MLLHLLRVEKSLIGLHVFLRVANTGEIVILLHSGGVLLLKYEEIGISGKSRSCTEGQANACIQRNKTRLHGSMS